MTVLRDVGYSTHKKYDRPLVERMVRTWRDLGEDGHPIRQGLKDRFGVTIDQIKRAARMHGIDTSGLKTGMDR